jgi:chromosome partitioning protein
MQNARPFIIAFASPKGGVGKSTSCLNIAGALCAAGHNVHIIDLDQTQTLGRWFQTHAERLATNIPSLSVATHPESEFLDHINTAFYSRTGFILVDVAGALGQAMLNAATAAHLTITPTKLSEADITEASRLHDQLIQLGHHVEKQVLHRILINEVGSLPFMPAYQLHALDQIANLGLQRFETIVHSRAAYGEVMFTGEPPHYAGTTRPAITKAVEEIDFLLAEIFALFNTQQQHVDIAA